MFHQYFNIQTKDGRLTRYIPNKAQKHYHKNKTNQDIILKARQLGFSTMIKMDDLDAIMTQENVKCTTIADTTEHATEIYSKVDTAWNHLPENLRNVYNKKFQNVKKLYLESMLSQIVVSTSGRSGTTQRLHISEFAFMTPQIVDEVITGSFQSVPLGGNIVIESTANGNNHFRDWCQEAQEGKNGFKLHFYNWTWEEGYSAMPVGVEWKSDYTQLAQDYGLIEDIKSRLSLSDNQFYWYYIKTKQLKEKIKQEYPSIPEEAFLSTGKTVFDMFKVSQLKVLEAPYRFKDIVSVWEQPKEGHNYIIGIDTSEGVSGDSSTLAVLDDTTNEFVAEFISNTIEPQDLAHLAVDLGNYYNRAFIIPERNASGLTTVTKIRELDYRRLFINQDVDKITQEQKNEYGWRTTTGNRDLMIDEFREGFHEGQIGITSPIARYQLETFVLKDNGKREHENGKHDDLLFAMFLAWQGKKYCKSLWAVGGNY